MKRKNNPGLSYIGKFLKEERQLMGKSLRDVSKSSGINHATLFRIESGKNFDMKTFIKLCRYMNWKLTKVF
jgi:transcriptional regulator with XRE-family HTH domain